MFTGVIEAICRVAAVKPAGQSAVLTIDGGGLDMSGVAVGGSIACNGVCLTVTSLCQKVLRSTYRGDPAPWFAPATRSIWKSLRLSDSVDIW